MGGVPLFGPLGAQNGGPPKKAPILRKMPFQYFGVVTVSIGVSVVTTPVPPHDDVVVVV